MSATAVPLLLEAPTAVPGYLLEELTARRIGSWSVYRAQDLAGDRTVALTLMSAQLNHDPEYGRRFEREMPEVAGLQHPNLVEVLDAGRVDRGLYVVTELDAGESLERTFPGGIEDAGHVLRLLGPIADALDRAHERGLVHRGVAPDSIVLAPDGHALLADFGLVDPVAIRRGPDLRQLAFVAPELVEGAKATPRSDVYGLAATLYWALHAGAPPSSLAAGARPAARSAPAEGARVAELDRVLRRSLAADPALRARSAGELISGLAEVAQPSAAAPIVLRDGSQPDPRPRRSGASADTTQERAEARTRPPLPFPGGVASGPAGAVAVRAKRRRNVPRPALLTVLGLAALALAIGFFLVRDVGPSDEGAEAAGGAIASTRELSLRVPASWSLADRFDGIAGLPLDESMQLLPSRDKAEPRPTARLLVGLVREPDDQLLPPGFASRLTIDPEPERVMIGRYAGYRYAGLVLRGTDQRLNLYSVPTTQGAATVACVAEPGSVSFLQRCEAVATTLKLLNLEPRPLQPSRAYVDALNATLERLNVRRREGRAALRQARTPDAQARSADALARSYAAAANEQSQAPPRADAPKANDALVKQLRGGRDAYAAVASSARRGDEQGFAEATEAVARLERGLTERLARIPGAAGSSGA